MTLIPDTPLSHRDGVFAEAATLANGDTLEFSGSGHVLILRNPTGAAISPRITGSAAGQVVARGIGLMDLSGGYDVGPIPAGGSVAINLWSLRFWLTGSVTLTNCAGLVAVSLPDAMSLRTNPARGWSPGDLFPRGQSGHWAGPIMN